jgi:hypothetical protein
VCKLKRCVGEAFLDPLRTLPILRPRDVLLLRLGDWTVESGSAGGVDGGPGCMNDARRADYRSSSFERAAGTEDSSSSLK